jgi:peptidase M1-like protein
MAAIIGKIRRVPPRRAILFLAAVFAAIAITARGQGGSAQQGGARDLPLRRGISIGDRGPCAPGVQCHGEPEPGARSPRNASYDIDVRLDHAAGTLSGRQTVRWRNTSVKPTSELQFHLYWNAWRNPDSTWLRERKMTRNYTAPPPDGWSAMDVSSVRLHEHSGSTHDLTSQMRFIAPDDGNQEDRTVMAVPLGRSVEPNETIQVELTWTGKIPRPVARTGAIDDYYFIAQWFPKLGVLEDTGWNTHQFHASTEFYADFGIYDVRITVPSSFIVGATGRQASRLDNGDGSTSYRYREEDVHDFAWTASPDYIDVTRTFTHPTLPRVEMRLLLLPEHRGQEERYFAATEAVLKRYGDWFGAYPYGHLTVVDPAFQSQADGMEYPTFFTGRARYLPSSSRQTPEMTVAHETGHQWWYSLVATNEFEHAWMDEGINTYATARVLDEAFADNRWELRYFGGHIPWSFTDIPYSRIDNDRIAGYRDNAEADMQATPTFRYWPSTASIMSYNKTALWLHTLENHLGWPVMQRILSTFFQRWAFKHPQPADFFQVANEVSGQDLTWFFDQVYRSSNTFDYGVQDLVSERRDGGTYRTTVIVRRYGEATFPVDVLTTFTDGHQISETWNGLDRRAIYVYERAFRAAHAKVDPRRVLLLDTTYTNNSRTLAPRSGDASLRWAARWMVWLQDLMLTYAFFL